MTRPLIIAHRCGAWPGVEGEQTLAHLEQAIAAGVDCVEVDLRQTADRQIVCVHDPDHAGMAVATTTLTDLQAACARAGVPAPPTLAALLEACVGRVKVDLELKVPGIEAEAVAAARTFGIGDVLLKSFQDPIVRELKRLAPEATVGLLLGVRRPKRGALTRASEVLPEVRLARCRADFVAPHHRLLRLGFLRRMRRIGCPVYVWTVNEPALMARLLPVVAGIITDRPAVGLTLRDG